MAGRKRDMKKQAEWSRAYSEKNYDRLYPFVPKGRKAEIQAAAEAAGETLNEYIVKAIDARMVNDESKRLLVLPTGESCPEDCPQRGEVRNGDDRKPWCFKYATEIVGHGADGVCCKCAECLCDMLEE